MQPDSRVVVFIEALREWAELPAGHDFVGWGAAVAYEAAFGIWRGHAARVLHVRGRRITDDLWRDRSREIVARAEQLAREAVDIDDAPSPADGGAEVPDVPLPEATGPRPDAPAARVAGAAATGEAIGDPDVHEPVAGDPEPVAGSIAEPTSVAGEGPAER